MGRVFVFFATLFLFFLPGFGVRAATFSLVVASSTAAAGDTINVTVAVSSPEAGFNAAQAALKFPRDLLEVAALDRFGSIFNFWLEEPSFSNERGVVTFIGGSSEGLVGKELAVLRIVFQTRGSGTADLVFSDGAITASDGSGTNILTAMRGVKIAVLPRQEIVDLSQSAALLGIRAQQAQAAAKAPLPPQPQVEIMPYTDPSRWYRVRRPLVASWQLPPDVSGVAAELNQTAEFSPAAAEGRIERKKFSLDAEGIWYLHVRFKNAAGWGPATHQSIRLDATPPVAISVSGGKKAGSHPQPAITYSFGDLVSGISHYRISVDGGEPEVTTKTHFTLPPQAPGKHRVAIIAFDKAGNETTEELFLNVIPLPAPIILSAPHTVLLEDPIEIRGTALGKSSVNVVLKNSGGGVSATATVQADNAGAWQTVLPGPSSEGNYFIEVIVQDQRGAQSEPVRLASIKARKNSFLNAASTIIGIEVVPLSFITGFLGVLLAGFVTGRYSRRWW